MSWTVFVGDVKLLNGVRDDTTKVDSHIYTRTTARGKLGRRSFQDRYAFMHEHVNVESWSGRNSCAKRLDWNGSYG
jgi:hypothetical protein